MGGGGEVSADTGVLKDALRMSWQPQGRWDTFEALDLDFPVEPQRA